LEDQQKNYNRISSPFSKLRRSRNKRGIEWTLIESANPLPKELKAAKKKSEMVAGTYSSSMHSPSWIAGIFHQSYRALEIGGQEDKVCLIKTYCIRQRRMYA
jgi:hypothetical protein